MIVHILKLVGGGLIFLLFGLLMYAIIQDALWPAVSRDAVLRVLAQHGALTGYEIGRHIGIKGGHPMVLYTLWSLADMGLVKRSILDTTSDDLRAKIGRPLTHWVITEEGRAILSLENRRLN